MPILYFRVNVYIEYRWSNILVDPYKPDLSDTQLYIECKLLTVPTNGWMDVLSTFKSPNEVPEFKIITYFATRTILDRL